MGYTLMPSAPFAIARSGISVGRIRVLRVARRPPERNPMPDRQNSERSVRVWFRLIRLEARMQAAIGEKSCAQSASRFPQCDVLTTLTEQGRAASQQELAARLYVTKGNISGLIDRLVEAGLCRAPLDRFDWRQHAIYLTRPAARLRRRRSRRPAPLGRLDLRSYGRPRLSKRWRPSPLRCATSFASMRSRRRRLAEKA